MNSCGPQMPGRDVPLQEFALGVYGAPGVAPLCLALQDQQGADVNLLLFCCWAAMCEPQPLSAQRLNEAIAATAGWQGEVVAPLRALRRRLKDPPAGFGADGVSALRRAAQGLELEAECLELDCLSRLAGAGEGEAPCADLAARLRANLERYLARCGMAAAAVDALALDLLLGAIQRMTETRP